ncbi:winged helix-turn-helix transcriptional regulator [Streptomyces sp. R08]|uniref:Winged helix-turn-helix transcriptional regulator n=1 Tax=Streptomyces sp. R08 TaxID=3238624 RepID=A0AB39MP49_9ACTN
MAPAVADYLQTPLAKVLNTLGRRWPVLALQALGQGNNHFNELQRRLCGINHKVLIETLRSLQSDGLVDGPLTSPGMTSYQLTVAGSKLLELVDHIRDWTESHPPSPTPRRIRT